MKIAVLVWGFLPNWLGGTEVATYNMTKHLARRGHEVHLITSSDEGIPEVGKEQGFHVYRVSFPQMRFLGTIIFWLKASLILKRSNPDIVHAQSIGMGMPGFLVNKFLNKSYVVWCQGSDVYFPSFFGKPISKLVLKNADAIIALTEDMKSEIRKICNRDAYVIPNGIDLESFENLSRENTRRKLEMTSEQKIIIFVGTLRPVKGVKYLIQAMNIIRQENIKLKLLLIGDGEERQSLEALVKESNLEDCVTFMGRIPNEKVPQYMAASDIFVLPSLSEGFPVTILEAMASGLPIVASKVGGLTEIVRDGENGFLVEPKNPEEIAERVLLFLNNDELRQRISRNNKEKVKDYSWGSVVSRLEGLYQSLL